MQISRNDISLQVLTTLSSQAPELIILKLILLWSMHSKFYELLKAVRMFFNQCTKGNIHIMQTEEKQYCSRDILDFSTTEHVYRFLNVYSEYQCNTEGKYQTDANLSQNTGKTEQYSICLR
ncbi:hypothetical protein T09_9797 [Trichinella sp. T9]|nr:hypothetical protein T09_9797 [Trichinella sp. T9]